MKIYIGSDHRGFNLKEGLKHWLTENGYEFEDVGADSYNPEDDYPEFAQEVAKRVAQSDPLSQPRGIVACGTGVGVDIVANKFNDVRSGLGINATQVKSARSDDDINVLAIAADVVSEDEAREMVKTYLETQYVDAARHARRIQQIEDIEKNDQK